MTKEECWTVPPCYYLHGRPAVGPASTEFVYPGCWHFDNGATRKIDDNLTEHGGLLYVISLADQQVGDTTLKLSYSFSFFCGNPPSCFKVRSGWVAYIQDISVSPRHLGTNWGFDI